MNYGIGNVKDKSKALFTTTTAPTESGGVITLATTDIVESGFKVGDYLAYVDSDNISALYSISAISSGTATLSLVGNIGGGGKQLYQHEITVGWNGQAYTCRAKRTIVNSKAEEYTKAELQQMFGVSGGVANGMYGCVNTNALTSLTYQENTNYWQFGYIGSVASCEDSLIFVEDVVSPC